MSKNKVAVTKARYGYWHWLDSADEWVPHWSLLPARASVAEQADIANDSTITILDQHELGTGSYGIVFRCDVQTAQHTYTEQVIKLPVRLWNAAYIYVDSTTMRLKFNPPRLDAAELEHARHNFSKEFDNFERIYETAGWRARFAMGERGHDLSALDLRALQTELRNTELVGGRAFIHEYYHYDPEIPAIFSAKCDGTLKQLRKGFCRSWFCVQGPDCEPSSVWMRCGLQIASALDYMRSRELAHTDIKLANIFYVGDGPETLTCKVSDFGLCTTVNDFSAKRLLTTPYYAPQPWPLNAIPCDPLVMTVHNFACAMAELLALPQTKWPHKIEGSAIYRTFAMEVQSLPAALYPPALTAAYEAKQPTWCHILRIFRQPYYKTPLDGHFEHILNFMASIEQRRKRAKHRHP